jgi:hypothetical protein
MDTAAAVFFFACRQVARYVQRTKYFGAIYGTLAGAYGQCSIGTVCGVLGSPAAFCGLTYGPHGAALTGESQMNVKAILRAYAMYIAFNAATKIVVRPIATSLNVPLITTIVS